MRGGWIGLSPRGQRLLVVPLILLGGALCAKATLIMVPEEYPEISQAIDAAASGDTIDIDGSVGPYVEPLLIDSQKLTSITLQGRHRRHPAQIHAAAGQWVMLQIKNESNSLLDVTLRHLEFDGLEHMPGYGIRVFNSHYEFDEPLTTLRMLKVIVARCNFGVQVGSKTGVNGCDGDWGAVAWDELAQSRSRVEMYDCTVVECGNDAMRLFNISGFIESCLVACNGDEAIHTTQATDLRIEHNIIVRNANTALHFQLPTEVEVFNNIVTNTQPRTSVSPAMPGYGITVGGAFEDGLVRVHNNLLLGNDGAGVKVNPVEVVFPDSTCQSYPFNVDLRNNVFLGNAICSAGCWDDSELLIHPRGTRGNQATVHYNRFDHPSAAGKFRLDDSNQFGTDLGFIAPIPSDAVPDTIWNPYYASKTARRFAAGYALADSSAAIDAGDPSPDLEDGGGLSRGSRRNDLGAFGGPSSSGWLID